MQYAERRKEYVSRLKPSVMVCCCLRGGKNELKKKKMNPRTRKIFLDGLRYYSQRGVRILLDGKEADIEDLEVIFEEQPDGSFYMGDYVLEDIVPQEERSGEPAVKEDHHDYGDDIPFRIRQRLKEIRFDRVYHR